MKQENNAGHFLPIQLKSDGDFATVLRHGAHVTGYTPAGQKPVLWTSREALFAPSKAIRGGIPVIWPWFGGHPADSSKSSHGIARKMVWQSIAINADELIENTAQTKLQLLPDEQSHPDVDGTFQTTLLVTVGAQLAVSLTTKNVGEKPFDYSAALHSYFAVGDARQIKIKGLDGRPYIDQLDGNRRKVQSGPIVIDREVDNIYLETADTVEIHDPVYGRVIEVSKEGSLSTVVWNPWIEKAARMADFGDDEYLEMVCVETCNTADDSQHLLPGESHTLTTQISCRPL
ncbi:MAG: glucose-6-phosphate 1-epimerase [Cellvibrionaceae bacterium]|jgi:glucose-6-phosphate 1-epimerase